MSLRRVEWTGVAHHLAEMWRLNKTNRTARCNLRSHPYGWELVLEVDGELVRSQAFRESDPVFDAANEWKDKMLGTGWHQPPPIAVVLGCVCVNGWRCEQHPDTGWRHGNDCIGPGVPCSNPACETGVTLRHQLAARRLMASDD